MNRIVVRNKKKDLSVASQIKTLGMHLRGTAAND